MNYLKDTYYLSESNIEFTKDNNIRLPEYVPGTLYITDSAQIASSLLSHNYPVAAHSHSENRNDSFSKIKYILEDIDEIDDEYLEKIYRRIIGVPWDIIETKNLLIRETKLSDLDDFYKIYSSPEITRYMEDLFSPEQEREYIQKYIDNIYGLYEIGIWTLIRKSDNKIIGRIGIEYKEEPDCVEMGFVLGASYQGYGHATEAGLAVLEFARSIPNIKKVYAKVHNDNKKSHKLCERMGMILSGEKEKVNHDYSVWEYVL